MNKSKKKALAVIGWREWVEMPDLGIKRVKAKIDTGARSSSLHAFDIKTVDRKGRTFVNFRVHPLQRNSKETIECQAEVLEYRLIRSSTGHAQKRPVIVTEICVLGETWPVEVTLANRDDMGFRMLLGREAVRGRFMVDCGKSFYGGQPPREKKKGK
ncbi:MAG: hypothetical protein DHS20C16_19940 [Phycisphaerae bacterium]|nr:MAG: hypothetical protein DHS20C16_19940 [Phycisphaerae bacterium]